MFTRYSDTHKAYRLIDVNTDRLIFSCDVVFDEELGPFQLSSSLQHSKTQPSKRTWVFLFHVIPLMSELILMHRLSSLQTMPFLLLILICFLIQLFLLHLILAPLLFSLNGGLRQSVIFVLMNSLRVEPPKIRAFSITQLMLLSWLTSIVSLSLKHMQRPKEFQNGNRQWMLSSKVFKRITPGFSQIFLQGRNPLAVNGSIRSNIMQTVP